MTETEQRKLIGEVAHAVDLFIRRGEFQGDHVLVDVEGCRVFGGSTSECLIYLRGRKDGMEYEKCAKS